VARETRTLRISLESPLRALREFMQTDPTRTEDDLEAVDAALMEATREVGEWLAMIDGLPAHERGDMEAMGASAGPIRSALAAEGWAFERSHLRSPGRPDLDVRLEAMLRELGRIEAALQVPVNPYRVSVRGGCDAGRRWRRRTSLTGEGLGRHAEQLRAGRAGAWSSAELGDHGRGGRRGWRGRACGSARGTSRRRGWGCRRCP
jgi:hypothetical protein